MIRSEKKGLVYPSLSLWLNRPPGWKEVNVGPLGLLVWLLAMWQLVSLPDILVPTRESPPKVLRLNRMERESELL